MGELVTAFGLGNTAILNNVCLLPLYPGLLAFLAGNAGPQQQNRARMGLLGSIVLLGVLTMMIVVALLLHLLNAATEDVLPILLPAIYGVVILLGVLMILGFNPWARFQSVRAPMLSNPYFTAFSYGLLLGPMTLPCIAPLIITAFALGANDAGKLIDGILYFLAFGLGFGWPLVVLPLVAVQSQRRFIGWMTQNHGLLTRVSGVLLIGIGVVGFMTEVVPNWRQGDDNAKVARWEIGPVLQDHTEPVYALTFAESGLVSAGGVGNSGLFNSGADFDIRLWSDGGLITTWAGLTNSTESLATNGDVVASGGWDGQVHIWRDGIEIAALDGHTTRIQAVAFSAAGDLLATGSEDGLVQLWTVENNTFIQQLTLNHSRLTSLAFNVEGTLLVTGSLDNTLWLWDVAMGARIQTLTGHSNWVQGVAFQPVAGGLLASVSADGTARLWDVTTGMTQHTLTITGQTEPINAVAWSPDGHWLAVAGGARVVVWSQDDFSRPAITFRQHRAEVLSLAFNTQWLASGDEAGVIRLWQLPD
ncbi:MAG: hypothetical protein H6673_03340 [Anaerolineales bacterium]|nr:hypothetical protein [Anaerolineales bacterium]